MKRVAAVARSQRIAASSDARAEHEPPPPGETGTELTSTESIREALTQALNNQTFPGGNQARIVCGEVSTHTVGTGRYAQTWVVVKLYVQRSHRQATPDRTITLRLTDRGGDELYSKLGKALGKK